MPELVLWRQARPDIEDAHEAPYESCHDPRSDSSKACYRQPVSTAVRVGKMGPDDPETITRVRRPNPQCPIPAATDDQRSSSAADWSASCSRGGGGSAESNHVTFMTTQGTEGPPKV